MIFVYCVSYIKLLLLDFNDFYVFIPTLKFDWSCSTLDWYFFAYLNCFQVVECRMWCVGESAALSKLRHALSSREAFSRHYLVRHPHSSFIFWFQF